MENNFTVKNITKSYGRNLVLNDVSFIVPNGSITGILGLNGVGKTTLFNVIAGFIDYKGFVGKENAYDIAYMSTDCLLFPELSIKDTIGFYKDFMPGFNYEKATADIKMLGLDLKKTIHKLSMGQKRIVMFVLTVYSKAKVYLFDEPLTNLDIIYRDYLVETMINTIDESKVYLIASHELLELENVFSHVMILKGNKLTAMRLTEDIRDEGTSISDYYKGVVIC